ncbi:hypothetical protein OOK29_34340 [Streptomyces phaeochromogenes]|uniref:hypothetical protein n=1 Tax=Streptomyces phaeochromogenes TaxID=1923 RepID=UPI002259DFCB|nr:hypothetical protein [Streptomyces phaeochromogenes]MCX5603229.1 hypothetical protein [Streptomyces phaeochromogenes]
MITAEQHEKLRGWFVGRLPDDLFESLGDVTVDREEITVVGRIPEPRLTENASDAERKAAVDSRIQEFRERTRDARVTVAREAEHRFGKKVSWGVECGGERALFTHVAAPVMTRLRQPQRQVLDTLIAAGVARSRSDALAWCVRLVERHADDWLTELRDSLEHVQRVRAQGPDGPEAQDTPPNDAPTGTSADTSDEAPADTAKDKPTDN